MMPRLTGPEVCRELRDDEATAHVPVILLTAFGLVNPTFALVVVAVALGYGMFVSLSALAVEEFSFHRYRRWRDLRTGILAAMVENVGYRQLHAWWRLQGIWRFARRQETGWGVMTRAGFNLAAQD